MSIKNIIAKIIPAKTKDVVAPLSGKGTDVNKPIEEMIEVIMTKTGNMTLNNLFSCCSEKISFLYDKTKNKTNKNMYMAKLKLEITLTQIGRLRKNRATAEKTKIRI